MNLPDLIDSAIEFALTHSEMTRQQIDEFERIADAIYLICSDQGLLDSLPKVADLEPEYSSKELEPVQYESKLKLPGDWGLADQNWDYDMRPPTMFDDPMRMPEKVFFVAVDEQCRWFKDMAMLRKLAESKFKNDNPSNESQPKKRKPDFSKLIDDRIRRIATDKARSVDDRLRDIAMEDNRFYGWKSKDLAEIMGCSDAAIRQTEWWKVDRKALRDHQRREREDFEDQRGGP